MPDAIFFDMDDTLVFWEIPALTVWESAANRFAGEPGGLDSKAFYTALRASSEWYWSDLERHRQGRLDLRKARREVCRLAFTRLDREDFMLADKIADTFSTERENGSSLEPGAVELLKDLRRRGIKLGMITNGASDIQRAKIEKFQLAPLFDNILIEGEFACGKPDERVFLHTLEKLKVKPANAWMVGDDLRYDIAPCGALGIYSLWIDRKGAGEASLDGVRPDRVIKSISEITGLL